MSEPVQRAPDIEKQEADFTPAEKLSSHLIDVWCAEHGGKISWEKAVKISAIVTKMPDAERDRLLSYGEDERVERAKLLTLWRAVTAQRREQPSALSDEARSALDALGPPPEPTER